MAIENVMYINDFSGIFFGIAIVLGILWLMSSSAKSKSFRYRKYLTNLYVSAYLRKKAKEHDLDISQEEKNFLIYYKHSRRRFERDLDDRIEQALSIDAEEDLMKEETKKD